MTQSPVDELLVKASTNRTQRGIAHCLLSEVHQLVVELVGKLVADGFLDKARRKENLLVSIVAPVDKERRD